MATDAIPQSTFIQDDASSGPPTPTDARRRTNRHGRRNRRAPFSLGKGKRAPSSATGGAGGTIQHVRGRNPETGELLVLVDNGPTESAWQLMDQRKLERRVAAQVAAGFPEPTYAVRKVHRMRARNVIPGSNAVARFVHWDGYDDASGVWVSEDALLEQGVLCPDCKQFECLCGAALAVPNPQE